MIQDNYWREKSLENLDRNILSQVSSESRSYLINTCHLLCKKPLQNFTIEDLRIMVGQEIGLFYLIPLVIEVLTENLFAEGDMFEGDLLKNVLNIDTKFWDDHKQYWLQLNELIKDRKQELEELKFDLFKFENSKHS